ncbi:MAG: hypothetical protein K9L71_00985 [Candidatus Omnitrophica bacterium]|nr:hypothetical protein [Candidatus Omnitrophota bacterium]
MLSKNMKKIFIIFFLMVSLQCIAQEVPTLKVDYEHWMIERNDGSVASSYEIPPVTEFVIDVSEYSFSETPNLIFVSMRTDYKYTIQWQTGTTQYVVSKNTVRPLANSKPFPKLYSGQEIAIFIGQSNPINGGFNAFWYSIIKVQ